MRPRLDLQRQAFQESRLAEDEFEKQLALIRIQSAWHHAGQPRLTSDALRKWAIVSAIEALDLSPREGLQRVRQLRDLARENNRTANLRWFCDG